jgi:hypothetical protein
MWPKIQKNGESGLACRAEAGANPKSKDRTTGPARMGETA